MGYKLEGSHVVTFALDPHWAAKHVIPNPQKILHAWSMVASINFIVTHMMIGGCKQGKTSH